MTENGCYVIQALAAAMINFPSLGAPRRAAVLFQPFQTHETRTAENRQRGLGDGGAKRYHLAMMRGPVASGSWAKRGRSTAHHPDLPSHGRPVSFLGSTLTPRAAPGELRCAARGGYWGLARIGFWPPAPAPRLTASTSGGDRPVRGSRTRSASVEGHRRCFRRRRQAAEYLPSSWVQVRVDVTEIVTHPA
jgi:hypothetical protein